MCLEDLYKMFSENMGYNRLRTREEIKDIFEIARDCSNHNSFDKNKIKIQLYNNIKLQIQNKVDNLNFYNYIYKNATIYLDRKKKKYEEFRKYYEYNY